MFTSLPRWFTKRLARSKRSHSDQDLRDRLHQHWIHPSQLQTSIRLHRNPQGVEIWVIHCSARGFIPTPRFSRCFYSHLFHKVRPQVFLLPKNMYCFKVTVRSWFWQMQWKTIKRAFFVLYVLYYTTVEQWIILIKVFQ